MSNISINKSKNRIIEIEKEYKKKEKFIQKKRLLTKNEYENHRVLNKGSRINKNEFNEIISNYKEEISYILKETSTKKMKNKKNFLVTDLNIINENLINNINSKTYSPINFINQIFEKDSFYLFIENKKIIKKMIENCIIKQKNESLLDKCLNNELCELCKINVNKSSILILFKEIIIRTYNKENNNYILNLIKHYQNIILKSNINKNNLFKQFLNIDLIVDINKKCILEEDKKLFKNLLNNNSVQKLVKNKLNTILCCFNYFQKYYLSEKIYLYYLKKISNNNRTELKKQIILKHNKKSSLNLKNKFFTAFTTIYYLLKLNKDGNNSFINFWKDICQNNIKQRNKENVLIRKYTQIKNTFLYKEFFITINNNNYYNNNNKLNKINKRKNKNKFNNKENKEVKIKEKNKSKEIFSINKKDKNLKKETLEKKNEQTESESESQTEDDIDENKIDINYFFK